MGASPFFRSLDFLMKNSTENELFCMAILFVFDVVKLLFLTRVGFMQNTDIQ